MYTCTYFEGEGEERDFEAFVFSLQTVGSEDNQGLADFGVIQYYGWKKVTIFQLDVDSFENVRISILSSSEKKLF